MAKHSIIGTSAAAYIGRRSVQKPEANIRRHDCRLPCRLHRSFSDFHSPWYGAVCWACAQAKVALKVKDTSPVFRQWDTQKSPAELPASTWSSVHPSWLPYEQICVQIALSPRPRPLAIVLTLTIKTVVSTIHLSFLSDTEIYGPTLASYQGQMSRQAKEQHSLKLPCSSARQLASSHLLWEEGCSHGWRFYLLPLGSSPP